MGCPAYLFLMNISFLIFFGLTLAVSDELVKAMSNVCQLDTELNNSFILKYSIFAQNVELAFCNTSSLSPDAHNFSRELDAPNVWLLLTTAHPSLLEDLMTVRDELIKINKVCTLSKSCLDWISKLLGDGRSIFAGSYLELLIRSLSATKNTKLAEMSTSQVLFVRLELRRMHVEREYLFIPRMEEMHELYCHYVLLYNSLINSTVGDAILRYAKQNTLSLTVIAPEMIGPIPTHSVSYYMEFFKDFVDFKTDFIFFNNLRYLKKTTNFTLVFQKWMALMTLIPELSIRREYFDEQKDVEQNFYRIENRVSNLYVQRNSVAVLLEWDGKKLFYLSLAFDFVDSLFAFKRQRIAVTKVRHMLLQILDCRERLMDYLG